MRTIFICHDLLGKSGKYCIDVLNQIYAIKDALSKIEEKILEKHFQHCATEAVKGCSEKEKNQIRTQKTLSVVIPLILFIVLSIENSRFCAGK